MTSSECVTRCIEDGARRSCSTGSSPEWSILAAGIVLIPHAPLGLITTGVQALAGVLLPCATVFLLLLVQRPGSPRALGERAVLNVVASLIVSILLVLSLILMMTTVFPNIDVEVRALALGRRHSVRLFVAGGALVRLRPGDFCLEQALRVPRLLELGPAPVGRREPGVCLGSACSTYGVVTWAVIGVYAFVLLVLAVLLLFVKAVGLGLHE